MNHDAILLGGSLAEGGATLVKARQ
jgi:hypothetical protein